MDYNALRKRVEDTWDRNPEPDPPDTPDAPAPDTCEASRLARLVSMQDWQERHQGQDVPTRQWGCLSCERLAEVVLPTLQMLMKRVDALDAGVAYSPEPSVYGKTLAQLEREAMIAALHAHKGVQKSAAEQLGISVRVMSYKVKALGLERYCTFSFNRRQEKGNTNV